MKRGLEAVSDGEVCNDQNLPLPLLTEIPCVAYRDYLGTAHTKIVAPMFFVAVAVYQGSSIMNPYW